MAIKVLWGGMGAWGGGGHVLQKLQYILSTMFLPFCFKIRNKVSKYYKSYCKTIFVDVNTGKHNV